MRILIAPNAFKNSLDASQVAEAIEIGLMKSSLRSECIKFPIADGGDGTGKLLSKYVQAKPVSVEVHDPLGRNIKSSFSITEEKTAIIEMADASGIRLLKANDLNVMRSSSRGTGELIRAALDYGAQRIILGVGGSATVDGGAGLLHELGVRFLEVKGHELEPNPAELVHLDRISMTKFDHRLSSCRIDILCDVTNPLVGEYGAARVFGPQKGASSEEVETLEQVLNKIAACVERETQTDIKVIKGGGAAGGVPAMLHALLKANLVNGINYFLSETGFENKLKECDLVITAEGSIDDQTLQGKGPAGVAEMAHSLGIPVIGFAGSIPESPSEELLRLFNSLIPIQSKPYDLSSAILSTQENLVRSAQQVGNILALKNRL